MAGASELFNAIKAYIPVGWDWDSGSANTWIVAACSGFVSMWIGGLTGAGIPVYPGSPPWAHSHVISTLTGSLMSAPLTALGYTLAANSFFTGISGAVAAYLVANTVISQDVDGTISHSHTTPGPPFTSFGSAAGLKSAMLGAISVTGPGVDPILDAFSKGIVDFLVANAYLATGAGASHTHALLV